MIIALVVYGWLNRNEGQMTPGQGLGYWLGISGSALMLLLLVYPMRKRWHFLRGHGRVTLWFRLHMIAGIIGPLLIIYHAGFKWGSPGSSIAMLFMLLVALSGLFGRYLYGKLHTGNNDQRAHIREIIEDATMFKRVFGADLQDVQEIALQMQHYETRLLKPLQGLTTGWWSLMLMRAETRKYHVRLKREAQKNLIRQARRSGWNRRELRCRIKNTHEYLGYYFTALNKAASYRVYERLFLLWHIVHLPLIFALMLTAFIHIVAVHIS